MAERKPSQSDEILPARVAERVLARASELDAALRSGSKVADLRGAAAEAGISPHAFDAALAEVQGATDSDVQTAARAAIDTSRGARRMRRRLAVFALGFVALVAWFGIRRAVPAPTTVPTVEQVFLLRCLGAEEAARLVQPLLTDRMSLIRVSPSAPGVLTVRTTPERLPEVRAALERGDAQACPVTPAPTP